MSCYNLNIARYIQRSSAYVIQNLDQRSKVTLMHHAYTCTLHGIMPNSQKECSVNLSIYDKPIAIAYIRDTRDQARSYEFTLFQSSNTMATTKAAGTV